MRLRRLHLTAFGPFTGRTLDLGEQALGLVLIYGPNEAGKSSALRAMGDLRYGIPVQSPDDFIHAYAQMRIGGEFIDRDGVIHEFERRKGSRHTLSRIQSADRQARRAGKVAREPDSEPVDPALLVQLTGGMSRDEFDAMYGLNSLRLREGGRDLLQGRGDVGAALFEASAGSRSMPRILQGLHDEARAWFVPRGSKGRINDQIRQWKEQLAASRVLPLRPATWTECSHRLQQARARLDDLQAMHRQCQAQLARIQELRAVAPLLRELGQAEQAAQALRDAPLLAVDVTSRRSAALTSMAVAEHDGRRANEQIARLQAQIDALPAADPILDVDTEVRRLTASRSQIDRHDQSIADNARTVQALQRELVALAAQIDPSAGLAQLLARAPGRSEVARIDEILRRAQHAEESLVRHPDKALSDQDEPTDVIAPLPDPSAIDALEMAHQGCVAARGELERLARLPGLIRTAQRDLAQALGQLHLDDGSALQTLRPLLDSQIDAAIQDIDKAQAGRADLQRRIDENRREAASLQQELDDLTLAGEIPTWAAVEAARDHRQAGWQHIRQLLDRAPVQRGERVHPSRRSTVTRDAPPDANEQTWSAGLPLTDAFEAAVINADDLIDRLAADTARATRLAAARALEQRLAHEHDELSARLQANDQAERARAAQWQALLTAARLPVLAPSALREWQALLPAARQALSEWHQLQDELVERQQDEAALISRCRVALAGITNAGARVPAGSDEVIAAINRAESELRQRQLQHRQVAGIADERRRQHERWVRQKAELETEQAQAQAQLTPCLIALGLPGDASIAVARARLAEFAELIEGQRSLDAAAVASRQAQAHLDSLATRAGELQARLAEPAGDDWRVIIDRLDKRLTLAAQAQEHRARQQQALNHAREDADRQRAAADQAQALLEALCREAAVSSIEQLPEAEIRSAERRQAQQTIARIHAQLRQASRQSIDQLREQLADEHDDSEDSLDAREHQMSEQVRQIEDSLPAARIEEEQARYAFQAIDSSADYANARDAMARSAAAIEAAMPQWIRARIAHALLGQAMTSFRERTQGPMLREASIWFARMTRDEFSGLVQDDEANEPVLLARRHDGRTLSVDQLSEGTLDQLYLALRLAALNIRRQSGIDLPVVLDDILMTSDDARATAMLLTLADFAIDSQVLVFTHHQHVMDLASRHVHVDRLITLSL